MFIRMDFYDGETLKKKIERGLMPVDVALDIAIQVARDWPRRTKRDGPPDIAGNIMSPRGEARS
jgi:hypothetical protein